MRIRYKVGILAACFIVGIIVDIPPARSSIEDPTRFEIEMRSMQVVDLDPDPVIVDLGSLGCDSVEVRDLADRLIEDGWRADLAADYGEALADPSGRAVVRFQC